MILDKIITKTREDLKKQKELISFNELSKSVEEMQYKSKNVASILRKNSNKINIIAEVKKASPSKGIIREDFDPNAIANEYERAGASALSILTEKHFFQGSPLYLKSIRKTSNLPILRKDFIIDKYQIAEAKLWGADFILLLVNSLSLVKIKELYTYAYSLGLEVLVETHSYEELQVALTINANIIGINHRNLKTFEMNMDLSLELMEFIPKDKILVAESGIENKEVLNNLSNAGVDAFLIGEYFMRQNDIFNATQRFVR